MRNHFRIKSVHLMLWLLVLFSGGIFIWNLINGPGTFTLLRFTFAQLNLHLGLRIDALSTLLALMISLLGAAIGRYAIRHLDGDPRQVYFFRHLLLIVLAVMLFVLSSNLLMLLGMWLLSSYGLHRLLLYYSGRPAAVYAARKKIIISRLGDLALLGAIILIFQSVRTFEFNEIFARIQSDTLSASVQTMLAVACFLIVAGAMAKSAQFPFHFWLPETMETPSPVSALMHAGIINAGGFLIIRLSPLLVYAPAAQMQLTLVGAFTAVYGALAMIVQNDIKKKLAYSTIGQMGMMMFACGLGAYTIALFHLFAHSFYKAHAFLSTGSLVSESRRVGFKLQPSSLFMLVTVSAIVLALIVAGGSYQSGEWSAYVTYVAVLIPGLFMAFRSDSELKYSRLVVFTSIAIVLFIALAAYSGIEYGMGKYLQTALPTDRSPDVGNVNRLLINVLAGCLFVGGFWLSRLLMRPGGGFARWLYLYFWNGGYASQMSTGFLQRIAPVSEHRWSETYMPFESRQ